MKMLPYANDDTLLMRPVPTGRRGHTHLSDKVALPAIDGLVFKKVKDIVLLEAEGNYTRLRFADGGQVLICKTLRSAEGLLDGYPQFIRIHRSYTINLNHLERYVRGKGGYVVMENGQQASVSSTRKPHFFKALKYFFGHEAE